MCSIFLLRPDADLKLDGVSLRAILKADGREYLFKILERAMRPHPSQSSNQSISYLTARLSKLNATSTFPDVLQRALAGDESAQRAADGKGFWACWNAGMDDGIPRYKRVAIAHAIEVEQACLPALPYLSVNAFDRVAAIISADALISPYATEASLARLRAATTEREALPARAACLCEFLLSQVARVDEESANGRSASEVGGYSALIDAGDANGCNPGSAFIRWVLTRFGADTLGDLLNLNAESRDPADIDESTLKRWSSGDIFPSSTKLGKLFESMLASQRFNLKDIDSEQQILNSQYWAARRLHKLLEISRQIHMWDCSAANALGWQEMIGDTTPEAWCHRRYAFWMMHWRKQSLSVRSS